MAASTSIARSRDAHRHAPKPVDVANVVNSNRPSHRLVRVCGLRSMRSAAKSSLRSGAPALCPAASAKFDFLPISAILAAGLVIGIRTATKERSRSAECFELPVLLDRPNLNRTTQTSRGNSRSQLYGGVEVFRFKRVVPADAPSHVNEGTVRYERLPILHSHGRGVFRKPKRGARRDPGRVVDLVVLGVDPLLFVFGKRSPCFRCGGRGCSLVNQQDELHRLLLSWTSPSTCCLSYMTHGTSEV